MIIKDYKDCTWPYLDDRNFGTSDWLRNPDIFTPNCYDLLGQLFNKLRIFKSMSKYNDEEKYVFYYKLPKGTAEQYMDYEDFKDMYEAKNKSEYYESFDKWFPRKWRWFSAVFYCRKVEDWAYYYVDIAGKNYLYGYCGASKTISNNRYPEDYSKLIQPLFSWVGALVEMASNDGYRNYVSKHMDYRLRSGKILYKEYWRLYPSRKRKYYALYKGVDVDKFISHYKKGEILEASATRFNEMTANKYCELFKIASSAIGRKFDEFLPLQENFHRNSDGRNHELNVIPPDSSMAFDEWYDANKYHFDHTFEMRSKYGRIDLYVKKDQYGYYLQINGNSMYEAPDIMRIYLALYKSGVVAYIYNPGNLIDHYKGNNYREVDSSERFLGNRFPKTKIKEFISRVKWDDLEIIERK